MAPTALTDPAERFNFVPERFGDVGRPRSAHRNRQQALVNVAYYNFCWMHGSLNGTPAMAAKVASHPWSIEELYERVMATVEA